jgi:F-type H+-transporting ATPase subunit delta
MFVRANAEKPGATVALGEQLFAITDALDGSVSLTRILADPSVPDSGKAEILNTILDERFDPRVREIALAMVGSRWSNDEHLPEAIERVGQDAILADAQQRGALDTVAAEIHEIGHAIRLQRDAREALSDPTTEPAGRKALLDAIVSGRGDPATMALAERCTVALRGRRFVANMVDVGVAIAKRRELLVAHVTSAVELNDMQRSRLERALTGIYGRPVEARVSVESQVLGGLRIQIGANVIDKTVVSALTEARRKVAA